MSWNQIATSVSILSSGLKGYNAVSLTNFVASAESLIASGSAIEVANAFFLADTNITPNASSWTAVATGNTAYIIVTPSGSAGSRVLSAAYEGTAPTWVTSKGGWYASAASLTRYIGGVYKESATQYENAFIMGNVQGRRVAEEAFQIGAWNMQGTTAVTIVVGIPVERIIGVEVVIQNDSLTIVDFHFPNTTTQAGFWVYSVTTNNLTLNRVGGAAFDSTGYNDPTMNRGWAIVKYQT